MSEPTMTTRRPTGITIGGREVREGDSVWGVQPNYYSHGGDRNTAGVVFWSEYAAEWRIYEDTFAEFYAREKAGYPLAKLIKTILFPVPEIARNGEGDV